MNRFGIAALCAPFSAWTLLALLVAGLSACESCDACDRSIREAPPKSPLIATPLPGGATLITERPVIPEHRRANCHVCPEWCTQLDLRPLAPDTVVDAYRHHARIYAGMDGKHPYPAGWATLEQMACIAAGGDRVLKRRFADMLRDPDPAIRWPVAVHALQHGIDAPAAMATLQAMVGSVLDGGTADGPDGPDYASRAHFLLIDREVGAAIQLP